MLIQLLILVLCHTTLAVPMQPVYDVENSVLVKNLFENYIVKYKRTYDAGEKIQRLQYFKRSLAEINRLNERNPEAVFDITEFSDWSPEEKQALFGLKDGYHLGNYLCDTITNISSHDAPEAYDWNKQGAVTPVKDQISCGSCWAFSATAAVESAYAIKYKKQLLLSEQQLLDCDKNSTGCHGGWMDSALRLGTSLEVPNLYKLPGDAELKEVLFKAGPLAVGVDGDPLMTYKGGVITDCSGRAIFHGVLLVGYGTANGTDFWNIKNSWGPTWGEDGSYRMKRGNCCMGLGEYIIAAEVE